MQKIKDAATTILIVVMAMGMIYGFLILVTLNTFYVPLLSGFYGWVANTTSAHLVIAVLIVLALWPVKTTARNGSNIVRRKIKNEESEKNLTK